jgi:hypothetical protein
MAIDYTPVLLFSLITLLEIKDQRVIVSTVEKNRQLKDNYVYLINNCLLYVLAYHIA